MGIFDDIESFGKVVAGLVEGGSEPSNVSQGTVTQLPSSTAARSGRLGKAVKDALGSPILEAGQVVIAGMRLTTGWDDPERGEPFGYGSACFTRAGETIGSAYPGQDWHGTGAEAYETANRRQASRTESMAALDHKVLTVIAREAYQIAYHRDKLDDQSNYLGDLSYLTWPIGLAPGAGKAMKAAVELSAVSAALNICSAELYQLSRETNDNAAQLRELASEYSALTLKAATPDFDEAPRQLSPEQPSGVGPTAEHGPGRQTPTQAANHGPTPAHVGRPGPPPVSAAASVPQADPFGEPAAGEAVGPTESGDAPVLPTEMMSGMASAVGAVGGMIGSMVAPIAAALAGAAGSAGQSLSTLTSEDIADAETDTEGPEIEATQTDTESQDDSALPGVEADVADGVGPAPAEVAAESEELPPHPADTAEPPPPAATRPPQ